MDLEQVKQFITAQGWTPQERPRRKGKLYLYATKRDAQNWRQRNWKYIAPVSRLEAMNEQEILAILNK